MLVSSTTMPGLGSEQVAAAACWYGLRVAGKTGCTRFDEQSQRRRLDGRRRRIWRDVRIELQGATSEFA